MSSNLGARDASIKLLQSVGIRNFRIGLSKVFLKSDELDVLEREQSSCALVPHAPAQSQAQPPPPLSLNGAAKAANKLKRDLESPVTSSQQQQQQQQQQMQMQSNKDNPSKQEKKTAQFRNTVAAKLRSMTEKSQQESNQQNLIQPKLEQEYWWDVARVTSRDFELEQLQLKSRTETFKILFKLLAYVLFFMIVLTTSVTSKLALFAMVNALKKERQPDVYVARWSLLLSGAVSVPYAISTLSCLQAVLFSSSSGRPGWLVVAWTACVETLHTFGMALFLFKILPNVENVTGLFLMNALCLVPAVLKAVFDSKRGLTRLQRFVTLFLDLLAIALQATALILFKFVGNFDAGYCSCFFFTNESSIKIDLLSRPGC